MKMKAFLAGIMLVAATATATSASHLNGFCVRSTTAIQFVNSDGAVQVVLPGETGVVFAMPNTVGRITIAWNKSFDAAGKQKEVNYNVIQTVANPLTVEIVECLRHSSDGTELRPFQGWQP